MSITFQDGFEDGTFDAWTSVSGDIRISINDPYRGVRGAKTPAGVQSDVAAVRRNTGVTLLTGEEFAGRFYIRFHAFPYESTQFIRLFNTGSLVDYFKIYISGTQELEGAGRLRIASLVDESQWGSLALRKEVWYRIEFRILRGQTNVGQLEVRLYRGDNEDYDDRIFLFETDTADTNSATVFRIGDLDNFGLSFTFDQIRIDHENPDTWIGPDVFVPTGISGDDMAQLTARAGLARAGTARAGVAPTRLAELKDGSAEIVWNRDPAKNNGPTTNTSVAVTGRD